jgi:CHRD domain/PEP-CTERM motif
MEHRAMRFASKQPAGSDELGGVGEFASATGCAYVEMRCGGRRAVHWRPGGSNMKKWIALAFLGLALAVPARAMVFTGSLTGANENPPVDSPGSGFVTVTMDLDLHTLRIEASFQDLLGTVTAAHIHCCTTDTMPNVPPATQTPSFTGFPTGVTSGTYDMTFDTSEASTWNASFVTANGGTTAGAETAFFNGMMDGRAYFNIHSTSFPGGEIRSNLVPIPEPSTYALLLAGLAVVGGVATRRRR